MNDPDEVKRASSEIKGNSDDRVLFVMLVLCFILTAAVVILNVMDAPEFEKPVFIPDINEEIIPAENIKTAPGSLEPSEESANEEESSREEEEAEALHIGINSATSEELQQISGIGPVTAKKIIDYREANGTITELDELLSVDGIGKKTLENLKKHCFID